MWHVTCGRGATLSQNFSSLAFAVWDGQCLEDLEKKDHWLTHWLLEWITKVFLEQPRLHRVCYRYGHIRYRNGSDSHDETYLSIVEFMTTGSFTDCESWRLVVGLISCHCWTSWPALNTVLQPSSTLKGLWLLFPNLPTEQWHVTLEETQV